MLRRGAVLCLAVFLLSLTPMDSSSQAASQPAESLEVNLALHSISQVTYLNESSWFETTITADITYQGSDPPRWVGFSESSVPGGNSTNWIRTFAVFGNDSWTQVSTFTWKPLAMLSGPYAIPGHYTAFATGDVNNWPNENISFIFARVVSTVALSGARFNAPVNFNFDDSNSSRVHYYTGVPRVIVPISGTIYGSHVYGQKVRVDLSHEGTVLQELPIVPVLRVLYIPLIAVFAGILGLKALAIILSNISVRSRRVADLMRRQRWLPAMASYGSKTMAII